MKNGMTKEDCINAIIEAVDVNLNGVEVAKIDNIIEQYTNDLSRAIIRASSLKVSEIIERAINEVKS